MGEHNSAEGGEPQFVTILPNGTELDMNDLAACREVALRVERLARRLTPRAAYQAEATVYSESDLAAFALAAAYAAAGLRLTRPVQEATQ